MATAPGRGRGTGGPASPRGGGEGSGHNRPRLSPPHPAPPVPGNSGQRGSYSRSGRKGRGRAAAGPGRPAERPRERSKGTELNWPQRLGPRRKRWAAHLERTGVRRHRRSTLLARVEVQARWVQLRPPVPWYEKRARTTGASAGCLPRSRLSSPARALEAGCPKRRLASSPRPPHRSLPKRLVGLWEEGSTERSQPPLPGRCRDQGWLWRMASRKSLWCFLSCLPGTGSFRSQLLQFP
ncbi:uncharacterized protein LOC142363175 [Opisthocomus hoazin]|uniref:uncharacterized protein LOC142363175 n=1 Tax=Opisthocomus hoazin TaxID=30419 RepID=UPI003F52FEB7